MVAAILPKGSRVEVSSDDAGFHGAWYVATLVDVVEASPTKRKSSKKKNRNKEKIGYKVKYDSLFQEDNSTEYLTEIVDPCFVRPLPPRNPRRDNANNVNEAVAEAEAEAEGGDLELLDIVDAYHLDGWWTGVVTKVITDGEITKYIVSFESPPEDVEFDWSRLRLHVDWIDNRWQVPPKKTQSQECADKNATQTSELNNDAPSGFTTPTQGASTTNSSKTTVGCRLSAKKKTHSQKKAETHAAKVGAVDGSVTPIKNGRIVNSVEENSRGKRLQSSAGSKGNAEVMVSVIEASESHAIHQDSIPSEQGMIITETCEASDGKSPLKRKRGRPPKALVKTPNGLLEDNQEAGNSGIHEMFTEEQPLSVWYQGLHPPTVLKNSRSSCCTGIDRDEPTDAMNTTTVNNHEPSDAMNPAIVNNLETIDYQQDWPFIKRSPIWATIESLELYHKPPQKPHFSPLNEIKEDYREGLAIAHMVTFANVVQRTSKLQVGDPNVVIQNSLETLTDLETHGFDVGAVRARLNELLSRKGKVVQLEDELKEVKKEIEKRSLEVSKVNEEANQLEAKLQELQEKLAQTVTMKKEKEKEVMALQSNLQLVAERLADWKVAFEKLAGSPL